MERAYLRLALAAAFAGLVAVSATPTTAQVIYDNLSVPSGSPPASVLTTDSGPLGDSFSTGAAAVDLADVKVLVDAATPTDGGSFTVGLFSNSAMTTPGTLLDLLGTVADSALGAAATTVDLPVTPGFALAANTRYWIELSGSQGSGEWYYTQVNDGIGVANEYNYYAGSASANAAFTPYQMQISVAPLTAVPEPASAALLIAGIAAVGAILRARGRTPRIVV